MWRLYTLLAVLFMSFNSFIVKILSKKQNPLVIMVYQFGLAAPLVFSYLFFSKGDLSFNPLLMLIGAGYFVALSLFYTALKKGNLTKAGPIFSLNLLVTSILGFIVLNEPFSWKSGFGLLFGVLSIYFLRGEN